MSASSPTASPAENAPNSANRIATALELGVHRLAIRREPLPADVLVWAHCVRLIRRLKPDVLHGHGAKAAPSSPENRFKAYRPGLHAARRFAALSAHLAERRAL